jgi:hypothetical protein
MWTKLERLASIIRDLTIVAGIFVGLYTFVFGELAKRVDAVGEYKRDYASNVRKPLQAFLIRWRQPAFGPAVLQAKKEEEIKGKVLIFFIDDTNQTDLSDIADFFDSLWHCVKARVCDQNTAKDFFDDPARNIYEVSGYYILERRKDDLQYAEGLEEIYRLQPQGTLSRLFTISEF